MRDAFLKLFIGCFAFCEIGIFADAITDAEKVKEVQFVDENSYLTAGSVKTDAAAIGQEEKEIDEAKAFENATPAEKVVIEKKKKEADTNED